jgi:hypothetical protein
MSSVTSCVGGGLFICFTCLHVPYSTVTLTQVEHPPDTQLVTSGTAADSIDGATLYFASYKLVYTA